MSKKKKFKQVEEATAYLINEVKRINSVLNDITYYDFGDSYAENVVPKKYRYCDCKRNECSEEKTEIADTSWEAIHDIIMNEGSDILKYIGLNCMQCRKAFNKKRDMLLEVDLRDYMFKAIEERNKPRYIVNSRMQPIDFLTNANTTLMINLKMSYVYDAEMRISRSIKDVPIKINFAGCICPSHAIKLIFSYVRITILRELKSTNVFKEDSGALDGIALDVAESVLGLFMLSRMYSVLAENNEFLEEFTETLLNTELPFEFHPDRNCLSFAFKCDTMKFIFDDTAKDSADNLFILPITNGEAHFHCGSDDEEDPDTDGEGIDLPESEE